MSLLEKVRNLAAGITGRREIGRLTEENAALRDRERLAVSYIRRKVNQLLMVMGTLPLRPEELDDQTLLDLDPIGIVADSFAQVLEHLNETNEKLRFAKDEIQAILSAAGVGILVVDNQQRVQTYNAKLKELFLGNEEAVLGQPCSRLLCNRDIPPANCTFERVMTTHLGIHAKDWAFRDRHFDVAAAPIKNRYGEIVSVVLVYSDITDRKRTEEALRDREELYRGLFDSANDLIQSVAPDGRFRYVNRAWLETLRYSREEVATLALPDIIHPDERDHCLEFFRELLAGRRRGRVTTLFVGKDGTPVKVEGSVNCTFADGKPVATCGIFRPEAVGP